MLAPDPGSRTLTMGEPSDSADVAPVLHTSVPTRPHLLSPPLRQPGLGCVASVLGNSSFLKPTGAREVPGAPCTLCLCLLQVTRRWLAPQSPARGPRGLGCFTCLPCLGVHFWFLCIKKIFIVFRKNLAEGQSYGVGWGHIFHPLTHSPNTMATAGPD